jgi:hypothetical protein
MKKREKQATMEETVKSGEEPSGPADLFKLVPRDDEGTGVGSRGERRTAVNSRENQETAVIAALSRGKGRRNDEKWIRRWDVQNPRESDLMGPFSLRICALKKGVMRGLTRVLLQG